MNPDEVKTIIFVYDIDEDEMRVTNVPELKDIKINNLWEKILRYLQRQLAYKLKAALKKKGYKSLCNVEIKVRQGKKLMSI